MTAHSSLSSKGIPTQPTDRRISGGAAPKRAYVQVEYEKRKALLDLLNSEFATIKSAAAKLNINYSTAKNIVKLYRKDKRVHKLPKKVPLTLKKITTVPEREQCLCAQALLPFYDAGEAQNMLAKLKPKSNHDHAEGAAPVVTPLPAGPGDAHRLDSSPVASAYIPQPPSLPPAQTLTNTSVSTEAKPQQLKPPAANFNFLIYSPLVLGRYRTLQFALVFGTA
jgi:hypothetical protein